MTHKELILKIDRARWWSLREQPFYGQLAMGLADILDPSVPTACTDGKVIRWNPDFLEALDDEEARFLLLHEAMHPAHGHLWRLPPDENGNTAGDYCINSVLATIPGIKMPKGGLMPPPEFAGLAEEEIYARLPPPRPGKGKGKCGYHGKGGPEGQEPGGAPDPGGCGSFTKPAPDAPGKDGAPGQSLKDEWERRIIQADQFAKATGKGNLPADLQRVLDRVRHQPIDWRQEMADFVKDVISTRNDWSRSARRHAWQSVIYPRKKADALGLVVFARDTSGSIGQETCAAFSAHISQALADAGCRGLVLDCDASIQDEVWLDPGAECPLTAKGGGGTSHVPIWERLRELQEAGEHIAGVVCLTDLDSDFPDDDGGVATLWLATSGKTGPFGRTVRIES